VPVSTTVRPAIGPGSAVGAEIGLSPAFDTAVGTYTATVGAATDLIDIAYSAVAAGSHVQIAPADASLGAVRGYRSHSRSAVRLNGLGAVEHDHLAGTAVESVERGVVTEVTGSQRARLGPQAANR